MRHDSRDGDGPGNTPDRTRLANRAALSAFAAAFALIIALVALPTILRGDGKTSVRLVAAAPVAAAVALMAWATYTRMRLHAERARRAPGPGEPARGPSAPRASAPHSRAGRARPRADAPS
jgi:hypothetical protein